MASNETVLQTVPRQLLVGGEWVDATSAATFEVHNPADGSVLTSVADATPADGERALAAAAAAQREWRATEPRVRGEILRSAFELLTERADDFARLMTLEMGKTLAEAKGEVAYGAEFFRWFSEEAVRIHGRYSPAPAGNTRLITMKGPVGPTLMITPWNFPLAMGTRKIGPAIAAGLHDGGQAGRGDPPHDARPCRAAGGGRPAGGRAQRRHHHRLRRGVRAADP